MLFPQYTDAVVITRDGSIPVHRAAVYRLLGQTYTVPATNTPAPAYSYDLSYFSTAVVGVVLEETYALPHALVLEFGPRSCQFVADPIDITWQFFCERAALLEYINSTLPPDHRVVVFVNHIKYLFPRYRLSPQQKLYVAIHSRDPKRFAKYLDLLIDDTCKPAWLSHKLYSLWTSETYDLAIEYTNTLLAQDGLSKYKACEYRCFRLCVRLARCPDMPIGELFEGLCEADPGTLRYSYISQIIELSDHADKMCWLIELIDDCGNGLDKCPGCSECKDDFKEEGSDSDSDKEFPGELAVCCGKIYITTAFAKTCPHWLARYSGSKNNSDSDSD